SRRRHTRSKRDWSSDVCSSDLFKDVIDYLEKGDTLVLNDTRVMPARLFGLKEDTGAKVEMLMLTQIEGNDWEVLLKPAKRIKIRSEERRVGKESKTRTSQM